MASTSTQQLQVRPDELLHACVAYTRPEAQALNTIISLHSQNTLQVDVGPTTTPKTTLLSLPPEILLRVRTHLQAALVVAIAEDTATQLEAYESALVDGLCPDCFAWNYDLYGADVWEWVENGYREACRCCVVDPEPSSTSTAAISNSSVQAISESKRAIGRKYAGLEIYTRRQWLDAHISRTYLTDGGHPWRDFVPQVLSGLGCACAEEQEEPYDPSLANAFAGRFIMRRRALLRGFGMPVGVMPLKDGPKDDDLNAKDEEQEDPAITLRRVVRELELRLTDVDEKPETILETAKFAHKVHLRSCKPSEHYFRVEWHPSCNCMDCMLNLHYRSRSSSPPSVSDKYSSLSALGQIAHGCSDVATALVSPGFVCALGVFAYIAFRVADTTLPAPYVATPVL